MSAVQNYPLGSDPVELARLDRQGRVLASATKIIFEAGGIREGMRVLDLGCGAIDRWTRSRKRRCGRSSAI